MLHDSSYVKYPEQISSQRQKADLVAVMDQEEKGEWGEKG